MLRFIQTGLLALNLVLNCVLAMELGVRLVAKKWRKRKENGILSLVVHNARKQMQLYQARLS